MCGVTIRLAGRLKTDCKVLFHNTSSPMKQMAPLLQYIPACSVDPVNLRLQAKALMASG